MRHSIFCVSDTHAAIPPSPQGDVLACLHAGDFYNKTTKKYRMMYGDKALALLDWAEAKKPQYYSVRGNHDGADEISFFTVHSKEITSSAARLADDLIVVGVGWNGSYHYDLPNEPDIELSCSMAMDAFLKEAKPNDNVILLSHYPPWLPKVFESTNPNANNAKPLGWMFDCVRELSHKIKPMAIVVGHVHELAGSVVVYEAPKHSSLLVFPGPKGGILTVDTDTMGAGFIPNSP